MAALLCKLIELGVISHLHSTQADVACRCMHHPGLAKPGYAVLCLLRSIHSDGLVVAVSCLSPFCLDARLASCAEQHVPLQ